MKRITALLLALLLLSLVACGKKPADTETTTAATEPTNSTIGTAATEEATEPQTEPAEESTELPKEIAFTEMVAVENEECAITITGLEPDNLFGYTVTALLENKSSDKMYMFSVDSAAVNGVQSDPLFASEVAAGKKSNVQISFSGDDLTEHGVGDFTDIELTFRVYDSNDWLADPAASQTIHIYPYGEKYAETFVREAQDTDQVLVDNDAVTVIVTGYEPDSLWGYTVNLFLLNKTDKTVMFSAEEVSVNGFMADPFYARELLPGKCTFSSMSWFDSTLEENGITNVETIEFQLRVHDADDWLAGDIVNEVITLNP